MRRAPAPPPAVSTHPLPPSGAQAVASATTAAAAPAELAAGRFGTQLQAASSVTAPAASSGPGSALQEGTINRSKDGGKADGKGVMGPPPAKAR